MNPWMIIRVVATIASFAHLGMRMLEYKERKRKDDEFKMNNDDAKRDAF